MKACQKATKAWLEKMEVRVETYPEKLEANQEKTEPVAEHYEGVPCAEAMKEWSANVLHRDPNGAIYRSVRAAED
jgi:hypothetical protein